MCEQEPETVLLWGFRDVHDSGLSMSLYRRPDRLVIEIQAPMGLLNLGNLAENMEDADGGSAERGGSGGTALPDTT